MRSLFSRPAHGAVAVFEGAQQLLRVDLDGLLSTDPVVRAAFEAAVEAAQDGPIPSTVEDFQAHALAQGIRPEAYLTLTALQIGLYTRTFGDRRPGIVYSSCAGHAAGAYAAGAVDLEGAMRLSALYTETARRWANSEEWDVRGLWLMGDITALPEGIFEDTETAPAAILEPERAFVVGRDVRPLARRLSKLGVPHRPLGGRRFTVAHTRLAASLREEFLELSEGIPARTPETRWYSSGVGWVTDPPERNVWEASIDHMIHVPRAAGALAESGATAAIYMGAMGASTRAFSAAGVLPRTALEEDAAFGPRGVVRRASRWARWVGEGVEARAREAVGLAPRLPSNPLDALTMAAAPTTALPVQLRAADVVRQAGGVAKGPDGVWYVTDYALVKRVLRDEGTFSSALMAEIDAVLVGSGGESHHAVRRPLASSFSEATLSGRAAAVRPRAKAVLAEMAACGDYDLVSGFAQPFTARTTWDLLGVHDAPTETLAGYRRALLSEFPVPVSLGADVRPEDAAAFDDLVANLYEEVLSGRPTDALAAVASIPSMIATRRAFERGLRFLLLAGTISTSFAIGSGVVLLLRHPEVEAVLRADRTLIPAFVEEVLRLAPPFQRALRLAVRSADVGGVTIPAGAVVAALLAASNRDPVVFKEPDEVRLDRTERSLSFGYGPHFCIGHYWAKVDAGAAFDAILDAWPRLEAGVPLREVPYVNGLSHGPASLPMARLPQVCD